MGCATARLGVHLVVFLTMVLVGATQNFEMHSYWRSHPKF